MRLPSNPRRLAVAAACAAFPTLAFAHADAGHVAGFVAGFAHPLLGIDHVLAMTAVGLIAASIGGRARWLVPLAFVVFMVLGWSVAASGQVVPHVEAGIAASLVALGGMVALGRRWPLAFGGAAVAFFALFHGHAHGMEMPATLAGAAFAAGFVVASAALIGAGVLAGSVAAAGGARLQKLARVGGAIIAATGLGLLINQG